MMLEIRDRGTFIPALAVEMRSANSSDAYLLGRAGFGMTPLIYLTHAHDGGGTWDIYEWHDGARTMRVAHEYIEAHWRELQPGDVIDVEFILDETTHRKHSEREIA